MTLYDMHTRQPLADGTFTLQRYDSENDQYIDEGTFVSDKNGKTYFNKTNGEHQATISKLKNEGLWYVYK